MSRATAYPDPGFWTRPRVHRLSRAVIIALVVSSFSLYAWTPSTPIGWIVEVGLRTYLMFLCTVMAHEGSHGHLGSTRRANDGWGRLSLLPVLVPYMNFRKTHRMHHARTNIPGDDPDLFMKTDHLWQVSLRALAMPHWWLVWLRRRGWLGRAELTEWALDYLRFGAVYAGLVYFVGLERFLVSVVPALVLVSLILWYPFAVKTHEGFSQGPAETRSHDYFGHFAFWLTLGLSMHRVHHMMPRLAWIQTLPFVKPAPRGLGPLRRLFHRDVVREAC